MAGSQSIIYHSLLTKMRATTLIGTSTTKTAAGMLRSISFRWEKSGHLVYGASVKSTASVTNAARLVIHPARLYANPARKSVSSNGVVLQAATELPRIINIA